MKIIPLTEGSFTVDKTKAFVPFDEQKDTLSQRPTGSLLVEVQPFFGDHRQRCVTAGCGLGIQE